MSTVILSEAKDDKASPRDERCASGDPLGEVEDISALLRADRQIHLERWGVAPLLAGSGSPCTDEPGGNKMAARPHILLITADQFRWDCLGAAGNEIIQTPDLDTLAARGVRFRNGFTPDPTCVPARASIVTGNDPTSAQGTSRMAAGSVRDNHC